MSKIPYTQQINTRYFFESFPEINDILGSALQDFKNISVREASGIDICKKLGRKGAVRVLDPTLLAGREIFDPVADESSVPAASVVGFFLSPTPLQIKVLKTIAREKISKDQMYLC